MVTQRFNPPSTWIPKKQGNIFFLGLLELTLCLAEVLEPDAKMIEIGSYMGESTLIFASSGIFSKIYAIDPFNFEESFNKSLDASNRDWKFVRQEFKNNTRFFNNVEPIQDVSENVSSNFEDGSIDFIYIDGDHSLDAVKRDILLYLPKLKEGGIIAGHDYSKERWPGVVSAVNSTIGIPDAIFKDTSWMKQI